MTKSHTEIIYKKMTVTPIVAMVAIAYLHINTTVLFHNVITACNVLTLKLWPKTSEI